MASDNLLHLQPLTVVGEAVLQFCVLAIAAGGDWLGTQHWHREGSAILHTMNNSLCIYCTCGKLHNDVTRSDVMTCVSSQEGDCLGCNDISLRAIWLVISQSTYLHVHVHTCMYIYVRFAQYCIFLNRLCTSQLHWQVSNLTKCPSTQ